MNLGEVCAYELASHESDHVRYFWNLCRNCNFFRLGINFTKIQMDSEVVLSMT